MFSEWLAKTRIWGVKRNNVLPIHWGTQDICDHWIISLGHWQKKKKICRTAQYVAGRFPQEEAPGSGRVLPKPGVVLWSVSLLGDIRWQVSKFNNKLERFTSRNLNLVKALVALLDQYTLIYFCPLLKLDQYGGHCSDPPCPGLAQVNVVCKLVRTPDTLKGTARSSKFSDPKTNLPFC